MRRVVYAALAVLFAQGTLGCSLVRSLCGSFHKPTLSFDRAELRDISLTGVTIDLHFDLHNDNPVGINIAQLSYAFAVEGHTLVAGHPPNGLQVKADGVSDLSFPAHVEFAALAQTLEVFLEKNTAAYTASGSIGISTPVGVVTLPLSHSGAFDVPKLPAISIQAPTLTNLSLTGAHLNLPIQIENRNGFPLPFNGLTSSVTLAGSPVAAPSIPQQSSLNNHEKRVVNLGVDVNFASAGFAVAQALQRRQADINYQGKLNVAGYTVPLNFHQNFNLR